MVYQEDFEVEQFMDKYETSITNNMAETCCESISINQVFELIQNDLEKSKLVSQLLDTKLTYGHIKGSPELKQSIKQLYETELTSDDIIITNGAIGANFLTLYSIVNPGDKVICVDPTYQQLPSVSKLFSENTVLSWKLKYENNYKLNIDELESFMSQNPKLLIINNPNNPTGAVIDDTQLKKVVEICKKHNVIILCDEVYRPLYTRGIDTPKSIVSYDYDNVISTSSMSKAFSMAGLRLGWIVTKNKEIMKQITSKRDYNMISISMIDDLLAAFALKHYKSILNRNDKLCEKNLKIISDYVENHKYLDFMKPLGGSVCFIKVASKFDTFNLCTTLADEFKTLVVPGEVFNYPGFLRIGFGNSTNDLINGFKQLDKYFEKYE
ncbi:unnamed protein product [Candida verbasci]|uniref:Aminotransferase class I/classII large domain-containing protein n=1 Tax=Candida verbasci TaxID=1227364 RepID=A0A9W4XAX7_9ASCO|nr:unnamed protein product [Candida verbasci]